MSTPAALYPLLPVLRLPLVELKRLPKGESGHLLGSGAASARADMLGNWVRDSLVNISDEQPDDPGPLRALAFVTTREVADEELFLNYRLNPKNSYPPWYTPVDLAEDRRRWQRK